MSKRRNARIHSKLVSLLVLEGDTEQIFYSIIRDTFLKGVRIELRSIKGQGNVNKDVLSEIYKYTYNNPHDLVRAYCCVDTERQTCTATPFDLELIHEKAKERKMKQVLSIDAILAGPNIESWFFYDIEGIYKFLRAPRNQRNARRYNNPQNCGKRQLQELFHRFGKVYLPGKRSRNFVNNLNIAKIVLNCKELNEGIELIRSQADNLKNHLFPTKECEGG